MPWTGAGATTGKFLGPMVTTLRRVEAAVASLLRLLPLPRRGTVFTAVVSLFAGLLVAIGTAPASGLTSQPSSEMPWTGPAGAAAARATPGTAEPGLRVEPSASRVLTSRAHARAHLDALVAAQRRRVRAALALTDHPRRPLRAARTHAVHQARVQHARELQIAKSVPPEQRTTVVRQARAQQRQAVTAAKQAAAQQVRPSRSRPRGRSRQPERLTRSNGSGRCSR